MTQITPETEQSLSLISRGYDFFQRLQKEGEGKERYYIFLFSPDDEINRWTLYFLPVLMCEQGIAEFMIISPYADMLQNDCYECNVPHTIYICTDEEMRSLCAYFYCINDTPYRRNILKALINGAPYHRFERMTEYIGVNGITKKEAVALSIMLLPYVPDDREINLDIDFLPNMETRINSWEKFHCDKTDEILPFPQSTEIGLEKIIKGKKIGKDDDLVIFSVTKTSGYIINRLNNWNIVAVLDNNPELSGSVHEGIKVYTPQEYLSKDSHKSLKIIVPTRSYQPICEQLYDMGYHIGEDVFVTYIEYIPYNAKELMRKFQRGKGIYEDIRKIYPQERLYFITYPGIGDTYLAGMYLQNCMKFDGVSECVVVFITETCRRVFNILDHGANVKGEYVVGDYEDAMQLLLFIRQIGYDRLNVRNVTHSFDLVDPGYLRGYKGLDFNTMNQRGSYHAPVRKSGVGIHLNDAGDIFRQYGLRQGKTVLIAPYANSARGLTYDFWEGLTHRLTEMGYDVCTNIAGKEKAIDGTIGLSVAIEMVCDFVQKAGIFIGLRSGLCDLLSGISAKKIILYSLNNAWGSDYTYDFFGMTNMGIGNADIHELIVEENFGKCIEEICQLI